MRRRLLMIARGAIGAWMRAAGLAAPAGRLGGAVRGPDGEVVPGAAVTISSPALIGGPRVAESGPDGSFAFPGLDPGVYAVEVELSGFRAVQLAGVRVSLARATAAFPHLAPREPPEPGPVTAERPA